MIQKVKVGKLLLLFPNQKSEEENDREFEEERESAEMEGYLMMKWKKKMEATLRQR